VSNKWKIPSWLEAEVRARDTACVYCGTPFVYPAQSRRSKPSWEHIINDETIISRENIALCCVGCNASKGQKLLADWLESAYAKRHGVTREAVAEVIRKALNPPQD